MTTVTVTVKTYGGTVKVGDQESTYGISDAGSVYIHKALPDSGLTKKQLAVAVKAARARNLIPITNAINEYGYGSPEHDAAIQYAIKNNSHQINI